VQTFSGVKNFETNAEVSPYSATGTVRLSAL
jgi:hypothetical protein